MQALQEWQVGLHVGGGKIVVSCMHGHVCGRHMRQILSCPIAGVRQHAGW